MLKSSQDRRSNSVILRGIDGWLEIEYLTVNRPNISFLVSVVSQFMTSPCDSHWDAVIRILRYIKSAPGKGLLFEDQGHDHIPGYTDADW